MEVSHGSSRRTRSSSCWCSRGENDKADRANDELPDQVDTDKHGDLLDKLGIDPGSLLGGIGNKIGLEA